MNSKQLSYVVTVIGCLVLLFGCFQFFTNQPKQFNQSESEQTIFGSNDLGNYLNLFQENSERKEKSDSAKTIMIVGGLILLIGVIFKISIKEQSTIISSDKHENNHEEFYYCTHCGRKIKNGYKCDNCNNNQNKD